MKKKAMIIRPIKTKADHSAALAEIEKLFEAAPNSPEGDRLDVLATLVEAYEELHEPILPPDPVDALSYWMESRGLTRSDLARCIGTRSRVSEVLNRKRALSLEMIRRLHDAFGIPAEVLIRPYDVVKSAA